MIPLEYSKTWLRMSDPPVSKDKPSSSSRYVDVAETRIGFSWPPGTVIAWMYSMSDQSLQPIVFFRRYLTL